MKMKSTLVAILLIAFCIATWSAFARNQTSISKVWEYKTIQMGSMDYRVHQELNELGRDRWELVSATAVGSDSSIINYVFKRPK